jgi:hypothetical protein
MAFCLWLLGLFQHGGFISGRKISWRTGVDNRESKSTWYHVVKILIFYNSKEYVSSLLLFFKVLFQ